MKLHKRAHSRFKNAKAICDTMYMYCDIMKYIFTSYILR